jgi:serine/threonine protein kinase
MRICPQCNTPYPNDASKCARDGTSLVTLAETKKSEAPQTNDNLIGTLVGNYRLTSVLGAGGMGSVYVATHISVGKEVAVKIIKEGENQNQNLVERFFREARSIGKIQHENIVDMFDFGTTAEGRFYLAMERLIGKDLAEVLNETPILPTRRAVYIATQIANGLEAAHQQKIIHRDLKPENIFLTTFRDDPDFVKILDFGIAKDVDDLPAHSQSVTDPGKFLGTPLYMAPEQGADVDHRSDIYALGLILYRMVTGEVAFRSGNLADLIYKHLTQPPPSPRSLNPLISAELERVILKALEKKKADRFSSMKDFSAALRALSLDAVEPTPAVGFTKAPRTHTTLSGSVGELRPPPKKSSMILLAGLVAVLVGVGSVLFLMKPTDRPAEPSKQLSLATSAPTTPNTPITPATTPTSLAVTAEATPTTMATTAPAIQDAVVIKPAKTAEPKKNTKKKTKFTDKPNTGL